MNLISAVIPTHNRPDQLDRAINSVRTQLASPVEVIVVDDASDPPIDRAALPAEVSLIRHDTPQGPAGARNAGAAKSTRAWIAFLDDDDIWLPGKVQAVVDSANRFPQADVICHRTAWNPSAGDEGTALIIDPLARVLHRQPPHISGVVVRRSAHEKSRFDESMWAGQDLDYLIRLARTSIWVEIRRDLSQHCDAGIQGSAIDITSRIEGRKRLLDKHWDLFQDDPIALSFFYLRLGHQFRRGGFRSHARQSFLQALRIRPANLGAWKGLARVTVGPAHSAYRGT